MPAHPAIEKFIRDYAASIGIDPDTAVAVSKSEALNVFDPSKPDRGGDKGSSFGPFQLHYGGIAKGMSNPGLGDAFTRQTGLDARDPSTWPQQVKFALDTAKQDGWRQWMGAKNSGIPRWAGIGGKGTGATVEAPQDVVAASYQGTQGPRGDTPSTAQPVGSKLTSNQYALPAPAGKPSYGGPGEGAGHFGGTGLGEPPFNPCAVASKDRKKTGWEVFGEGISDAAAAMAKAGQGFGYNVPAQPGPARVDVQPVASMDPQQAEIRRQQLAQAMARLNAGQVWG
jgi:hypothetical protein